MKGLVLQFEITRHNHEHRGRHTNSVCFMDAPNVLGLLETGWRILTDICLRKAMFPEMVLSLRDQHLAFEREVVRRAQALDFRAWQWGAEPGAMGPASSNATAAGVVDMSTESSATKGSPLEDLWVGATATEDALGDTGVQGALATVSSVAKAVSDDATRVVREALAYDGAAPPCITAAEVAASETVTLPPDGDGCAEEVDWGDGTTGNEALTEQALQDVEDLQEKLTALHVTGPTWERPSDQQRSAELQAGATSSVTAEPGVEADGSGPSQPLAAQEDSSAADGSGINASRKGPSQPLAAQKDWFDHDDEPDAKLRKAKYSMAQIQQQPRAVPHPFLREWVPEAYKKTEAFRGSDMCLAIQRTLRSRMFYEFQGDPDDIVEDSGHKCPLAHAACPREGQPWLTRMASASIAAMQELQGTCMSGETVEAHRERQTKAREYCAALLQDIPDVIFEQWGIAGFDRDACDEEKYRKLMNLCQGHKGETIEMLMYGSDWLLKDGPCPKMPWTRKEAQKCTDFRNAQFMCGHLSNDWDAWYRARATGQPLAALSFQSKDAQGMQRHSMSTPEHRTGMLTWRFAMDSKEEPDWEYQTHRFFVPCKDNVQKHWARETFVTTLGLLFRHLGDQYTATDLYMYYCSCRLTSVKFQKGALEKTTGHMLRRATTWSLQGTGEEILADYLERRNLPRPAAGGRALFVWMSRARMALHRAVIQEYQMPWSRQSGSCVPGNVVANFEWQLASATLLWWPLERAARICPPVVAKLRAEMGDAYPEQLQGLAAQPEYSCVATVFVDLTTKEQVPLEDVDQGAGCLRADSPSFARQGKDRHYVPLPCGERCKMDPSITTDRYGWLCPRHAHDPNHQPLAVAVDEETRVATRQLLVWPVIGNSRARAAVMRTDTPKAKLFVTKPPLEWRWQDQKAPYLRPNPMKEMRADLQPDEHRIGDMLVLQYTIRESDYVWRTASRYDPAAEWWANKMNREL